MSVRAAFDLTGRTALVTGGSRGLGLAMAGALGEMGAKVIISARKSDELDAAVASLQRDRGVSAVRVVGDLSRTENVNPFVDAVAAAAGAPIDILVNNAGATWGAPASEHPLEGWNKVLGLNLTGVFLLTQQIGVRWMIPRKQGRIVNIASIAGIQGSQHLQAIAYHTSKGGLVQFTRALAAEWGQYGISVNAICPGFIRTKFSQVVLDQLTPRVIEATPMKQLGEPADLEGLAVLLASGAARHITGQIIAVDGGASVV
ncbi:MAG TPA: SDR family oxidoreductase [Steroidobacteraceae bacterium]|nr:SDR family oxidoreductase [Steroidobacteraceae bacterium]